jgi:methionyl-tRNA formyltransferase
MKIVFMGTPQAAAVSLKRLIDGGHEIVAVYTQPDRPSGRGNKIILSPVKELAVRNDLPIFQPAKIKTPEALDDFRSHAAEAAIVVAYGRILSEGFLNAYRYGALNVHFSLLPKYRGAAPVNWAIVNGESQTGVTIIQMDAGLDTGDIVLQESTAIGDEEDAIQLMDRLAALGAELISETLKNIDHLDRKPQNHDDATFAPILKKEDGLIDWSTTAVEIERRIRGFQPFPTSYTFHGGARFTIWKAEPSNEKVDGISQPGTVIEASGSRLLIQCGGNSALVIEEIQPEGKRRLPVRDFLNGAKLRRGEVLGMREQPITTR